MFDNEEIAKIVPILKSGGILIFPTDTVWGLGCNALDEAAVEKVYQIKKRDHSKSMILLADDEKRIEKYVERIHPKAQSLIEFYKSPLTIIYDKAKNLPKLLPADDGSIAFRIVKDDFCRALIQALDAPIVATSANFSNDPTPSFFQEINQLLLNQADYVVKYRQDENTPAQSSVIVKINKKGELVFLRK